MNDKDLLKQQKTIANIIFHGDESAVTDYCQFASSYYSESYDPYEFDSYDLWNALRNIGDNGSSPHIGGPDFVDRYMYSGLGITDPDAAIGEFIDWLQERTWFKLDRAVPWNAVKSTLDAFRGSSAHDVDNFSEPWLYSYWARLSATFAQEVLYPAGWCALYCDWYSGSCDMDTADLPGSIAIVRRGDGNKVARLLNSLADSMCDESSYAWAYALWKAGPTKELVTRLDEIVGSEEQMVDQGAWRKLRRELRALMAGTIYA